MSQYCYNPVRFLYVVSEDSTAFENLRSGDFCALTPVGAWIGVRFASILTPAKDWSFSSGELVTTLLAGLTISIAVLASVIGLAAIWGYHAIKDEARETARTEITRYLAGNEVDSKIRDLVAPIIADEVVRATQSLELAKPIDAPAILESVKETETVGKPYEQEGGRQ
jgi:hypothetical protein